MLLAINSKVEVPFTENGRDFDHLNNSGNHGVNICFASYFADELYRLYLGIFSFIATKCVYIGFFTVNSPVIFLKYTFELRISCLILASRSVLHGVCRRTFHEKVEKRREITGGPDSVRVL